MNRRRFLVLGATGAAGAVLGRSMVTVPGLWGGHLAGPVTYAREVSIDDPFGYKVGDFIRRQDGEFYRVTEIVRDDPVGGELAIVEPANGRATLRDDTMMIYRHRFEHDGDFFHIGTSMPTPKDDIHRRLETWHPSFWQKAPRAPHPDPGGGTSYG